MGPFNLQPRRTHSRAGVALIVTVLTLTMLALLVVAFLTMANTERRSSKAYAEGASVRALSDSATNLVIGQIRTATENLGNTKTWASQPGAIRTYGTTPSGKNDGRSKLSEIYKLYSSDKMIEGSGFDPKLEVPKADWVDKTGIYTDLNEPISVTDATTNKTSFAYPVLTPPAKLANPSNPQEKYEIEGFDLDNTGMSTDGSPAVPGATARQPAPMPVKWLYQLKDGRFVAPIDQQGRTVSFTPGVVTKDNPIIGRAAFWTDDESAKVNVNTASQGAYFDAPLGNTKIDRGNAKDIATSPSVSTGLGFATSVPVRYEFARYTGHPARTCLSSILGYWLNPVTDPTNANYAAQINQYFKLTPRVASGGTNGGTRTSATALDDVATNGFLALDKDRLYASADELFYAQPLSNQPANQNPPPKPTSSSLRVQSEYRLTPEVMEKTRFFLTAQSRAPEVNLFNKPRIALWPIAKDPAKRNATDNLIAFATTTGQSPSNEYRYYIQRNRVDPYNNSSDSPTEDLAQFPRNFQIYKYLVNLMENNVPGYGGGFSSKYGADTDQIALEMFDYVRSQVHTLPSGLPPTTLYMSGNYAGVFNTNGEMWQAPLQMGANNAIGRMPTVVEAALVMYATADQGPPDKIASKVQAFLMLQFFRPTTVRAGVDVNVTITGLQNFRLNGQSMNFPATATFRDNACSYNAHAMAYSRLLLPLCLGTGDSIPNNKYPFRSSTPDFVNPLDIDLGAGGQTMKFDGGLITINLTLGSGTATGAAIQTTKMKFPSATWPRPRKTSATLDATRGFAQRLAFAAGGSQESLGPWQNLLSRTDGVGKDYRTKIINSEDVVRSVHADPNGPTRGDFRLFAATRNVPDSWFTPHRLYTSPDWLDRGAHSLREDRWGLAGQVGYNPRGDTPPDEVATGTLNSKFRPSAWSTGGSLVQGLKYAANCVPAVPAGTNGAFLKTSAGDRPGDWENGVGIFQDGPYIRTPFNAGDDRTGNTFGSAGLFMYGSAWNTGIGANYTPNREITSAVQFGALPTGVQATLQAPATPKPWQTLLFCPNPASRTTTATSEPTGADHPGFDTIHDHVLLDFFWMPVVEPYAISEPFSTAGKVNMNYEILPFRYIKRRTAINAVLKDTLVTALHPDLAKDTNPNLPSCDNYKGLNLCPYDFRYKINANAVGGTLEGFERRFQSGDIFHSASEICDIYLIPKPYNSNTKYHPKAPPVPTYVGAQGWWNQMTLSGDNARESSYNDIYPRLTTKSNVFRVHVRVQTLHGSKDDKPDTWTESDERIAAEYRGSFLLERYIDASDKRTPANGGLPDFATSFGADGIDRHYKFRIIDRKQFCR